MNQAQKIPDHRTKVRRVTLIRTIYIDNDDSKNCLSARWNDESQAGRCPSMRRIPNSEELTCEFFKQDLYNSGGGYARWGQSYAVKRCSKCLEATDVTDEVIPN